MVILKASRHSSDSEHSITHLASISISLGRAKYTGSTHFSKQERKKQSNRYLIFAKFAQVWDLLKKFKFFAWDNIGIYIFKVIFDLLILRLQQRHLELPSSFCFQPIPLSTRKCETLAQNGDNFADSASFLMIVASPPFWRPIQSIQWDRQTIRPDSPLHIWAGVLTSDWL